MRDIGRFGKLSPFRAAESAPHRSQAIMANGGADMHHLHSQPEQGMKPGVSMKITDKDCVARHAPGFAPMANDIADSEVMGHL